MLKPTDYQKYYCASNQRENEFVKTSPFLHSSDSMLWFVGNKWLCSLSYEIIVTDLKNSNSPIKKLNCTL